MHDVDIFIPTYEPCPAHLQEAIESVLAQRESNWRLLVHDDCSQCDVSSIVAPYLSDSRIRFERSAVPLGMAGNWNACLARAQAPFVQLLFQDDAWNPQYIERSVTALKESPQAAFCAARHEYKLESGSASHSSYDDVIRKRAKRLTERVYDGHAFLMAWISEGLHPNLIGEPSFVLMRTEAVRKAGVFSADLAQCLDMEYWTRLLQYGGWRYVDETLGYFRVHLGGASAQNALSGRGSLDRLICLLTLSRTLSCALDRAVARRALRTHVPLMIEKYMMRRRVTDNSIGKNKMRRRLPWRAYPVLAAGMIRYVWTKRRKD